MENTIDSLNHATAAFNTVGGFDKALALIQYSTKMVILLKSRNNVGEKSMTNLTGLMNLARIISDSRTLFRFRGSLPLIAKSLQGALTNNTHVTLPMKLQLVSMLFYYPLEHIYWLGSHSVLPVSPKTIMLSAKYSCRAWLIYNLVELYNIIIKYQKLIKMEKEEEFELKSVAKKEKYELSVHTFSMICYTYMATHYSLDQSPFNPTSVDVAGFAAALAAYLS
ncbi:hypothetical protein K502DRAFT_341559 [Neoconidiobolus thromboides FSU 785]|nr:hypothetical protein K502DRAFT_341559 [Neoconidiobolus thromboides FSU 785]